MVTSSLYQPSPFGLVVGAPVRAGAVLSMLIEPTVADAELSALSTACRVTDWLRPSPERVLGPGQVLMPDNGSEQVKLTVTSLLFQPFELAEGLLDPVMVGALLSRRTVTEPLPELPRRSVALEVLVMPDVFAVTESVAGVGPPPEAMPEPVSVADQLMVTSPLFQPAAFGVGERTPETTGPVLSST